jgi:hypothetical protein
MGLIMFLQEGNDIPEYKIYTDVQKGGVIDPMWRAGV